MLTLEEAQRRVEEIRAIGQDDPEVAHSKEDELHTDVLHMIATPGFDNIVLAKALCRIALSTLALDFDRWFA